MLNHQAIDSTLGTELYTPQVKLDDKDLVQQQGSDANKIREKHLMKMKA